jgi:c-di-GMP-binding flagellar brake protein YcgR
MGKAAAMKSEKIDTGIVVEACKRCFPVEIWAQQSIGMVKYAGSLLPVDYQGTNQAVKASVTLPDEEFPVPPRGCEVRVFFLNAGGIYSFKAPVLEWQTYKDAKNKGLITLDFPNQIKLAQRRNFFRVPFPSNNRAGIDVVVNIRDEKHVVKGTIKDLSGGGIAIRCIKSPMNFFELNTKVELHFRLPRRPEEIVLHAVVTRSVEEDSHYFYGLKFVDHFRTTETRAHINHILQYIFQFERLMLTLQ